MPDLGTIRYRNPFTPQSIVFIDSTGALNQDVAKLFWDDVNYILALNGSLKLQGVNLVAGDLLYADSAPVLNRLPKGPDNYVLTIDSTTHLPSWKPATGGGGSGSWSRLFEVMGG